jgi:TusA-related sulfurtransferase
VCPIPDVETKRALKRMTSGQVLEVIIDYPMSKERIPEAVKRDGNEVVDIEESGSSEWKIRIKKA